MKRYDVKQGDWVCFYQNNALIISVVRYVVTKESSFPGKMAVTDIGPVSFDSILEVRRERVTTDEKEED